MQTCIFDPQNEYDLDPTTLKGCWKNPKVGCFWVEANLLEVYSIFDRRDIPLEKCRLQLIDNPEDYPNFYFWISRDLSRFYQSFGCFPYSGMNGMKSRYIYFKPIDLKSLDDLKYIDLDKLQHTRSK